MTTCEFDSKILLDSKSPIIKVTCRTNDFESSASYLLPQSFELHREVPKRVVAMVQARHTLVRPLTFGRNVVHIGLASIYKLSKVPTKRATNKKKSRTPAKERNKNSRYPNLALKLESYKRKQQGVIYVSGAKAK
jgi:hypothetical protein